MLRKSKLALAAALILSAANAAQAANDNQSDRRADLPVDRWDSGWAEARSIPSSYTPPRRMSEPAKIEGLA